MTSGGNKRELYEFTKRLKKDGNVISLYTNSREEGQYLDLSKMVDSINYYNFRKLRYIRFTIPFLKSILNLWISLINIFKINMISKKMAKDIDALKFEYVFIHQCKDYVQSPFLIKYLKTKSIFFCAEPPRKIYDKGLFDKLRTKNNSSNISVKNFYTFTTKLIDNLCKNFLMKKIKIYDYDNINSSDLVLTNSYFSKENILSAYGLDSKVVHLGGDIFKSVKEHKNKKNQILTVGAINPIKCIHFLVSAIGNMNLDIRPDFVIVGNAVNKSYLNEIKKLANDNNVNIIIKINISDIDLEKTIRESLIFLYSPYLEPLGLAPLEAMSLGLPVIGVREGGVRETIVDGYNGFLVDRNIEIYSNKIKELILDKKKAAAMGVNSTVQIKKYWNWDKAYDRYLKAIK